MFAPSAVAELKHWLSYGDVHERDALHKRGVQTAKRFACVPRARITEKRPGEPFFDILPVSYLRPLFALFPGDDLPCCDWILPARPASATVYHAATSCTPAHCPRLG